MGTLQAHLGMLNYAHQSDITDIILCMVASTYGAAEHTNKHCSQIMTAAVFEPSHPEIVKLESTALDQSAKLS